MADNDLNNLPPAEEAPPAPSGAEAPPAPVEASGGVTPKGVDVTPDPTKVQSEIEDLRKQREKAEADAIYWRKQKAEARSDYFKGGRAEERQPPPPVEVPGLGPEPRPADFEDYDKYVGALTDYRVKKARSEWEMDAVRREQEKTSRQRAEDLQVKLQEGFSKYGDFEEVVFDRTASHITPMIVDILADCEHPADVAYYLTKNRVEGVAISRMTPIQAARAIAKLEDKLVNAPSQPPTVRKTTNAPAPINPITGAASGSGEKDPNKMSNKEYAEWRAKQGARRY
jgi:hypothetical protein